MSTAFFQFTEWKFASISSVELVFKDMKYAEIYNLEVLGNNHVNLGPSSTD